MKILNIKTYRNKSLAMKVLLGLVLAGCFLPQQAGAQPQVSTTADFVACVNMHAAQGVAAVAAMCIPKLVDCKFTNTMSEESAQPACTRNGVRLPRVILSCATKNGNGIERFRPSFSLCTTGGVINHVETGEDQTEIIDEDHPMIDADLTAPSPNGPYTLFGANPVLDTTQRNICADCHDHFPAERVAPNVFVNRLRPIPPNSEAPGAILSTTDPFVLGPAVPTKLSKICTEISSGGNFVGKVQALALCNALVSAGDN